MSFLHTDPQLLSELLKYGQNPDAYAQQTANFANIRQLIGNLESQLVPGAENEVSHEGDPGTAAVLRTQNLESLGALVNFLETNKITINGKRIAYSPGENPHTEDYVPYQLEPGGSLLEPVDRSKMTQGFVVNKDLLAAYLVSLQQRQQEKPNPVMNVMLTKLIKETNDLLETKISEKYVAPAKPGQTVAPSGAKSEQSGAAVPDMGATLEYLADLVPFNSQFINLDSLKDFADRFAALMPNDAGITNQARQVDQSIGIAKSLMLTPSDVIQLNNLTSSQFSLLTHQPQQLVLSLNTVITQAGSLYNRFMLLAKGKVSASAYRKVQQQIMSGGPQETNIGTLNEILSNLQSQHQLEMQRTRR
jgi:hypothetical protein